MIFLEYQNIKTLLQETLLHVPNWSEEVFPIKKCKNTVPWRYVISDLKGKEVVRIAKINQKEFRVEKLIKEKGNKLYVKWKGYNSFFNNCIDKKDIV